MRTTVNIDDGLLDRAKQLGAQTHRPLGDVIDDALRFFLARTSEATVKVDLPTYGGSGLLPGVDLEDADGLAALLDDGRDSRAAG